MTDHVLLAHGGGGELTRKLIAEHILPHVQNDWLAPLGDGAVLPAVSGRLCMTTDASVVAPLFFPGGDIGRLAVSGTVNDLAMMGADPIALSMAVILEEGLPIATLEKVMASVAATAKEAGVPVATGDTKVVERQRGDGLLLSTAGVGMIPEGVDLTPTRIEPGDAVLISGRIADHGLAVLSARDDLGFATDIRSDVAPVLALMRILREFGDALRFLRDPTRGGLAGVLCDLVGDTGFSVDLREDAIPLATNTRHAAEWLGLDPLGVANEGKLVAVVAAEAVPDMLAALRQHPLGQHAAHIADIVDRKPPLVELITTAGGRRIVSRPYGEDLPRIC